MTNAIERVERAAERTGSHADLLGNHLVDGFQKLALFVIGATTNLLADTQLIRLRKSSNLDYRIPRGGLFKWISCPNYLGEIIEWAGFAILAGTLPALSFAIWTAANLIPRAMAHHQWYCDQFPSYPSERKAIIPFVL